MEMMMFGWMEMLILIGSGGGSFGGDFASFLPADVYFQSRNIQVSADKLLELASTPAKNGKAEIAQLLALRLLAERPELIKEAKNREEILKTLEKVAAGEVAKDKLGFVPDYAARTLAALGRKVDRPAIKGASRDELLSWFPSSATLVGALIPPQRAPTSGTESAREVRKLLTKMMPPEAWGKVFEAAEMIGNVSVERLAFAFADDPKDGDRFYVRFTGKADQKRLVDAIRMLSDGARITIAESQDPKGAPIITVSDGDGVVVAFIGGTDCVIAGYAGPKARAGRKSDEVMSQLLSVRIGKGESVLKGTLQPSLAKVSEKAIGLLVGEVPAELRREMAFDAPAPRSIRAEITPKGEGVELRAEATMDSPEDSKKGVQMIMMVQKKAIDGLQKVPADLPVPAGTVAALKRAIESLQARAEGNTIHVGVFVPNEALISMSMWFWMAADVPPGQPVPGQAVPPPLPPPPNQKKKGGLAPAGAFAG